MIRDTHHELIAGAFREPKLWTSSQGIRFAQPLQLQSSVTTVAHAQSLKSRNDGGHSVHPAIESSLEHSDDNNHTAPQTETAADMDCQASISSMSKSDTEYSSNQDSDASKNLDKEQDPKDPEEEDEEVEEHIPLNYQIPEQVLRAAMAASPDTRGSFWGTRLYKDSEDKGILTHYCKTLEIAERVAKYFVDEKVIGFDIEWKPHSSTKSIKQNASLIQLACENRVALFHIALFEGKTADELLPPTLRSILESPEIIKVGVAVKGDFSRLSKYLDVQPQGVFELSRLHNLVEWFATDPSKVTKKLVGLAAQVLQHLQLPLYKGGQLQDDPEDTSNVRESDWSKNLNQSQIYYAASDAYAGFRLYHMLEWKRKQLRPTPPCPDLCDYDARAKPKAKPAAKKVKAAPKVKITSELDGTPETVREAGAPEVEVANEDDAGYETAAEDIMDSHELEDPAVEDGTEQSRNVRRVGRINSSYLQGPDPAYPQLPVGDEHFNTSSDVEMPFEVAVEQTQQEVEATKIHRDQGSKLENITGDDDFADPELDEAFQHLYLDEEGRIVEINETNATTTNRHIDSPPEPGAQITDSIPDSELETPVSTTPSASTLVPSPSTTHSPAYDQATNWAQTYLKSNIPAIGSPTPSRIRATVPHLRAYHLWHEQNLSLDDIASHLRDPALSIGTVTGYILQAVTLEKLEYDEEAMRDVVKAMPTALRKGRWKWMAEKLGVS